MKKLLRILLIGLVALALIAFGWLWYSTEAHRATPTSAAMAALASDDAVTTDAGDWLVMRPNGVTPKLGVIFYPGANCDIRGYAPLLHSVAAAGYLVVAVSMPFDFAIFAPDRADAVREAFPNISRWVIAGHSMGGAMAGGYAYEHQDDLAGLILLDAYPPEWDSLADSSLPVLLVHRALPNGQPAQKFVDMSQVFPSSSRWVPVPGGQHMYFGSFNGGAYEEEWKPGISREQQQAIAAQAIIAGLGEMAAGTWIRTASAAGANTAD